MSETLVEDKTQDISRIGVLDGIRVISMLFVVWFHFWQQTWLTPGLYFDSTIGKVIGLDKPELFTDEP